MRGFWLGANSVITRELFKRMGRLDASYMRFADLAGFCRARLRAASARRLSRAPTAEAQRSEPIEIA